MMLVHGLGFYRGMGGYNHHTRNFFGRLATRLEVLQTDLGLGLEAFLAHRRLLFERPAADIAPTDIVNVVIAHGPHLAVLADLPGTRIGFPVWEGTVVPPAWRGGLAEAETLWVPSAWGRAILEDNGYRHVEVVPEGVDPAIFHAGVEPAAAVARLPGFKFVTIGKWEDRKGTEMLLRAFDQEFADEPEATLLLAAHNVFRPDFDPRPEIRRLGLRRPEAIRPVAPFRDHAGTAALLAGCDAAVFPTRAEGWGLPILEAMACGLPTIVTAYSAPTAYANAGNSFPLEYRLVPMPADPRTSHSGGVWAEPDHDHLRHLMRTVFEDRAAARARGARAAADVAAGWTWDHAADVAVAALERGRR